VGLVIGVAPVQVSVKGRDRSTGCRPVLILGHLTGQGPDQVIGMAGLLDQPLGERGHEPAFFLPANRFRALA
jgi:hypothetical protein